MTAAGRGSTAKPKVVGPAVFVITLVAVLAFFWWFLIYDHGVPPMS